MSFPSNRSRHVLSPSSSSHSYTRVSMRPNLSWSTIREESSADLLSSEDNDKKERLNRLKKLERLKERRYMDYQSLKRRGSSKEYSDRFQRDCEEFNKLRYRQVHHTPNSFTISHQQRSASVSDLSSRRLHSSRHGANYSFLRGNQDDGQTLSPTGSISSIVTLDDNYMYGSGYPTEDLWRPRSRTSSFSARDRMAYYGLSHSHDMEDSLFDDVSSEYGYSSYVPQRRAFSSCVTPRMYSGIMTPTAQSTDTMATYERMNQLSERLRLLQSERVQLDQRSSADHSSSQTRSRLSSFDNTESATASSVQSRFNQTSQQILPQSPTDHSIPAWSQRVSLLLSAQQHEVPYSPSDANYRSSHVGHGSHYMDSFSRNSPDIVDSMHSTEEANIQSYHGLNQSHSPTVRSSVLSRSFVYHRPESSSTPISTTTSAMGHDRVDVQSPGHLSSTGSGTHFGPTSPISPSYSYKDRHEFPTSQFLYKTSIRDANQNANLDPSTNSFSRTEYSTHAFKDDRQRLTEDNTVDNFSRTTNPSHFTSDMSPSPVSPDFHKNVFGVRERRYVVTHGQQQEPQLSGQDDVSDSGVESSSDVGRVSTSVSADSISKFMVSASKPSESRGKAKFEISLEPSAQSEANSELSTNVSTPYDSVEADKCISSKNIDVSRKEKMVEVENPALTKKATMNLEISQPKTSGISHLPENKTLFEPDKTDSEIKENATSTTTIVKTADTYSTQMKEQLPRIDVQSFKSTDPIKDTKSQVSISTNKVSDTVPFDKETERIEILSKRPDEKYMDNVSEILSSTQKETSMISKTISYKMKSDDVSAEKSVGESHPEEAVCGNGSMDVTESRNQDISDQNVVTSKKKKSKKKKKNGVDTVPTTEEISVSTVESSVDLRPDSSGLDSEKSQQNVSVSSKLLTKKESDNLEKAANLPMETFTSPTPQFSNEMVISKMEDASDIYQNGTKGNFSGIDLGSSVDYKEKVKQQETRLKNISVNVDGNSKIPETVVQTTTTKTTDVQMDKSVVASDVDPVLHQNQIVITPSKVPLLESEDGYFQTENIQSKSPQNGDLKTKTGSTKSSKLDNTVTVFEKELQTSNGTANVTLVKTEQLMDATRKSVEKLQSGDLNSLENEIKAIKPTPVSTKLTSTSFQASSSVDNILIQEPSKMKGNPSAKYEDISTKTVVQETIEPEYPVTDSPIKGIPSENDKTVMKKEKSKKKKKNSSKNGKKDDEINSLVKESVQIITKDTAEVSPSKPDSFSAVFPSQQEVNLSGLPEKIVVTSLTKTTVSKMSESPEEYDVKSVSAELPGQPPQLKEFSQGNMVDKTASTDKIAGSKMAQRIPDGSVDYKIKSFSAEFPGQSTELSKDGEITSSVTTITKTTSIEVESSFDKGKELATKKLQNAKLGDQVDNSNEDPHAKILTSTEKSQRPKELDISSIPTEQTENSKDSSETSFFGRVASTLKNTFSKLSPEIPEKSEFAVPSIADFSADSSTSVDPHENSKDQAPYNTTNSVVTMLSEPQAYNTKSVTEKFLEKHEDPKLVTSPEQGDTFGKVTTMTTTKTVEYKTSEIPEEYNLQKFSAELPERVKVSQQTVPMKDNITDKVGTITEITGSKMSPGMSERPGEYQPHSVSVQSPGQIKSPTQIEFSQGSLAHKSAPTVKVPSYKMIPGMSDKPKDYQSHSVSAEFPGEIKPSTQTEFNQDNLTDKVVTTTVTSVHKMVPEMSNTPVELEAPSLSVNLPVQVPNSKELRNEEPATISTEIVTTTETIVEKVLPGSSNSKKQPRNVPPSESPKETAVVQQGDLFGKEMMTMKDFAYKKDSTDLEKPVDLKAKTISVEIPEHQLDLKKAKESTTPKVNERNPDTSKTNSLPTKAMKQPKEQSEKDKPGFLDKVTPTVNRPYTKKSEELPELIKESLTVDQNTANMPSNDKTSYSSIIESDVLPKTAAKMHKPIEDGDQDNKGISLGKDCLHNDTSTRVAPELTESRKLQPILPSNSQQTDVKGVIADKDVHVVQTTRVTEVNSVQSNSMEIPITGTDVKLVESTPETSLPERDFVTSITKTTISKVSQVPEEYNWQKISTRVEEQMTFPQDMADQIKSVDKATGIKMPPETSERPETYTTHTVSVEFPGQIKAPTQTELSQGTLADKVAPTVKVPSYKMAPGMSERPEEYQPHSVSVEFPGQIKSPTQTEFSQGTLADKVAQTVKVPSYKMAPGMSERPEEYQPHSVSVEFPGQIKSPTQTEFSQGTLADKVAPTVKVPSYKMAPGMFERPEEYQPHSVSVEFPGQIKSPTQTEFSQGTLADKVAPTVKVPSYKMAPGMSERPEEYQPHSVSVEFPGQIKSPTQTEFTQGTLAGKVAPTVKVPSYKMAPGMSERPEEYQPHSVSVEFPGQIKSPTQTEFSQGTLADKVAPTVKVPSYKMAPGMSERPEEYQPHSVSVEFPGQIKSPTQTEFSQGTLADKVAPTVKVPSYKMAPGMSERPEEYQPHSVSVEFPGQIKSPTQTEFSQGTLADKVAPTVKVPSYKMAPGMFERPEEYQPHSVSVEFPGQIKSPTQTEFSQGTLADKVAPTVKVPSYKMAPGMFERPEEYQPHSVSVEFPGQIKSPTQTEFSQGTLADKVAPTVKVPSYKMAPGMSERPEEYQPHSVSVEFPGQIKSPTQTEFSQGTLADKVAPTVKVPSYKMAPGMSERPEEYQPHSVSVEFPGQIKSPTQTEFSQGTLADKVVTSTVSSGYKSVPTMSELMVEPKVMSMSEEFPGHVRGVKPDQSPTHVSQISYKTVLEKDINAPFNNNDTTSNVSSISSGEHPDAKTTSFETSHLALEKPVTIIKKSMNLMNSSKTQEPETSLSQHDPKYVLANSTELQENLKNFGTDAATLSSDFLTTSVEPATLTRSDIVKNSKTDDASVEKSHKNISFPLSIDKVEKSGDRSSHPQQTENEGRFMSGGPEAMVLASPKMLEHAGVLSEDAVAPLKSKPIHPDKPVLRKLSGHDLLVSDIQKTRKPSLKLVAPDCTLLQTKFETDGWKPKVKSPTTPGATIVQSANNDANTQAIISENISVSPPVPPKRRSREFRSMSEESTSSDLPSPTSPLDFKIAADPQITSPQPQVPKRKNRKGSKTDRSSVSPDPSGPTDANVSLDLDRSRPISHPGFRVPDPDQDTDVFKDSSHLPSSHLSNENREKMIADESADPLNKSPRTSVTSEIQMRSPKVNQPPPSDHTDSVFVNTPSPDDPPFERTLSSDRSRTMPLNRKKINRRSHDNNDSDSDEKLKSQLSPTTRWKSAEILKGNPAKTETPPKNTGLNRVKSTSIKFLSKLQPKSKKAKSPGPTNDEGKPDDAHPDDSSGHGATREYPNVEKYPVPRKFQKRANKSIAPSPPTTPQSENPEETAAAHAPVAPLKIPLPLEEHDEPIKERVYLNSWDPTPLLKELYEIRLMEDDTQDLSHKFITMEGQMEKLPMNKKKATLLKTWKRRYFKAENGWLNYFDNQNDEKPSDAVLLMGGQIHAMGNNVIGIDDGRGRYLMVRCPSQTEYKQWLIALESQTPDNSRATYVRPSMNALKHPDKKVVMIELGSMSVRAGTLKAQATLPQLFFPNIVAISTEDNRTKHVIGFDAYKPNIRRTSHLVQPLGPTDKVDKFKFDYETLPSVFKAIFQDLKIASAEYQVMLILPMNIRDEDKTILMNILMGQFKVRGVLMASQALLALYSYNVQSGIIVDIGERLEVLPIYEGFVIDGGHTVQSFGAPKIRQSLRSGLTCENYPLYSPLEQILVRFIMEDTCFVSKNFNEECKQYQKNPEKYKETVYLKKYDLPEETYSAISHSLSRFVSPEGLFNTDLWGMDYPTIQSLVKNAIEACSMDNRRHLCRSIYLSGGVTLLPGFASRLEAELCKQLHDSLIIQVHASPQRYHAAYVGACTLCSSPEFEESCISSEEWKTDGAKAFQKWKMSS